MAIFVSTVINQKSSAHQPKAPGSPSGVAGSPRTPDGMPGHDVHEPRPIANRDVEITIPYDNRSLIDWVSCTFKLDDPQVVAKTIGLDPGLFTETSFGFSGYRKSLKFGTISIYYDGRQDMGCHLEMTGQGCRLYEGHFTENPWQELFQGLLSVGVKFTRLDLAIDNVDGALTLESVSRAIDDHDSSIRTQFSQWRRIRKGSFDNGEEITGDTLYLGSTKSHIQFRIYDKAQESGVAGHWIRFEIQLRDKRAHESAKLFASGEPAGTLATGIINTYFAIINNDDTNKSRCSLQSWWAKWLQTTDKIRLATAQSVKLVSDTMDFIKRQYAPSLAMINKHLGTAHYTSFIQELLEDGNERMSAKHERILAASAAVENNGGNHEQRR